MARDEDRGKRLNVCDTKHLQRATRLFSLLVDIFDNGRSIL